MKIRLHPKPMAILVAGIAVLASGAGVKAQTTGWLGDGSANVWSDLANWTNGAPGDAQQQLSFGAAYVASAGGNNFATASNDLSSVLLQRIAFEANAPAFTVTGNAFSLVSIGAAAPQIVNDSAVLQTISVGGAGLTFDGGAGGFAEVKAVSGDLAFNTTPVFLEGTTQLRVATDTGRNVSFTGAMTGNGGLLKAGAGTMAVSAGASYTGDIVVSGGTLSVRVQANVASPTSTGLGDMTVAGRKITINSGATVRFDSNNDGMGRYDYATPVTFVVDGGTLSHGSYFMAIGNVELRNGGTITGVQGFSPIASGFSLNGSVTVSGTGPSFITGNGPNPGTNLGSATTVFNVGATGAVGGDLIVTSPLLQGPVGGLGGLVKSGPGLMVLNYAAVPNLYQGITGIDEGALWVNGAISPLTAVLMNDGARFGRTAVGALTVASLSVGLSGVLDTYANVQTQSIGSLAITTAGGFTVAGGANSVTVNVGGTGLVAGQSYSLVKFGSGFSGDLSAFKLGTTPAGVVGTLILNALSGSLDFSVTSAATVAPKWTGTASGEWSTAVLTPTKNWTTGGAPSDFTDGDAVSFDDTATRTNITISSGDVSPGSVTFDHTTKDYTVDGPNGIAGAIILIKSGSGTLNLLNTNTYSGVTIINGGVLTAAENALGSGSITFGGGMLRYAAGNTADYSGRFANSGAPIKIDTNDQTVTFASAISATNTGGLSKNGPGTLILNAKSGFTGDVMINGGTVVAALNNTTTDTNSSVFGNVTAARNYIINAGATLEIIQNDIFRGDGDTNFPTGTMIIRGKVTELFGGFYDAPGTNEPHGPYNALPALVLDGGTLTGSAGANQFLEAYGLKGRVTVTGTAPSRMETTSGSIVTTGPLHDGFHLAANQTTGGNVFDVEDVTNSPAVDLEVSAKLVNAFSFASFGRIPTGFHKEGAGTMELSHPSNDYTGPTSVEEGTLLLNGSISGSPVAVIDSGTLGGQGFVRDLSVDSDGTVAPSDPATPAQGIGLIAATGSIILNGQAKFDIRKSGADLSADLLTSETDILYGGTLRISASGDALAAGDAFNLFDAPFLTGGTFNEIILPALSNPNLAWDTSNLTSDGTISVTAVPEPAGAMLWLGGLALVAARRRRA